MSKACCKETRMKLVHEIASFLRSADPSAAKAIEFNWIQASERGAYRALRHKLNSSQKLPKGMRWRGGIIHAQYTDSGGKRFERSTGTENPKKAEEVLAGWNRERDGGAIPLPDSESVI